MMMIHRRCDVQSKAELFGWNGWEVDTSAVALLPQALQSAWSCLEVCVIQKLKKKIITSELEVMWCW